MSKRPLVSYEDATVPPGSATDLGPTGVPTKRAKRKEKEQRRIEADPKLRLAKQIEHAAVDEDLDTVLKCFNDAKEQDLWLSPFSCQQVIHLCAGGEQWEDKVGILAEDDIALRMAKAAEVEEYMKAKEVPMTEYHYTAFARMACLSGDADKAIEWARMCWEEFSRGEAKQSSGASGYYKYKNRKGPRLRTYVPGLVAFCKRGNVAEAFKIEGEVRKIGLELSEHEYAALLECATKSRDVDHGRYVLQCMVREMPSILVSTMDVIKGFFWMCEDTDKKKGLDKQYVMTETKVSEEGVCEGCEGGPKVQRVDLKRKDEEMLIEKIVKIAHERGGKGMKSFDNFKSWYGRKGPFDVVIDGANVGFFGQSKAGVGTSFQPGQIRQMFDKCRETWPHARVLIVLHQIRVRECLASHRHRDFFRWLDERNFIFSTPGGSNDDWFWLYAAILGSSGKRDRVLVSNDKMRDHKFMMLSPKLLEMWRSCHQQEFHFHVENGKSIVTLQKRRAYTTCIQTTGERWFFPLNEDPLQPNAPGTGRRARRMMRAAERAEAEGEGEEGEEGEAPVGAKANGNAAEAGAQDSNPPPPPPPPSATEDIPPPPPPPGPPPFIPSPPAAAVAPAGPTPNQRRCALDPTLNPAHLPGRDDEKREAELRVTWFCVHEKELEEGEI